MYPPISSSAKVEEVVPLLTAQVEEFVKGGMSIETALTTVAQIRYNGRFSKHYGKVRHQFYLNARKSAASSRKENGAFTSGQHAALKWDEIHENAQVVAHS